MFDFDVVTGPNPLVHQDEKAPQPAQRDVPAAAEKGGDRRRSASKEPARRAG